MRCIVLSGGAGLRLWPLSRQTYPKQFLDIEGKKSLFIETIKRNQCLCDQFLIITNSEYRFIVEKELSENLIKNYAMLLETIGRNTAPAILLSCLLSDPSDILFVVPSDSKIDSSEEYLTAVSHAKKLAEDGYIATFGVKPTSPHTGYGYIKYQNEEVLQFTEKPTLETARFYFENGNYLWNSGMFMFRNDVFIEEMKKYRNDIYSACVKIAGNLNKNGNNILSEAEMMSIPSESVDYAVMEKSDKLKVIQTSFYWNDIGGLESFCETLESDMNGNIVTKNTIINNCKNISIINETNNLVVANELKDILVINTSNAVYISKQGKSAKIKDIIQEYSGEYSSYFNESIKSYRPWGYYEILVNESNYKVKRLTIYSGKRLSLQKHLLRSEHWTIVSGIATVTLGEVTSNYYVNQSLCIPIGELHRVANNTENYIEIIEVAIGEKVIEEDIIRVEDDFER